MVKSYNILLASVRCMKYCGMILLTIVNKITFTFDNMIQSTVLLFYGMALLLGNMSANAQQKESAVMQYLSQFDSKEAVMSRNGASEVEIMLIGTFHFRNKKLSVPAVEQQLVDFNPQSIYVEEVPPHLKEDHYNVLYSNAVRGDRFYSRMTDSVSSLTSIPKEKSHEIVQANRKLLLSNPADVDLRIGLINALFVSMDEPNGHLQISYLAELLGDSFESAKKRISPINFRYRFCQGETKYLTVPVAARLGLNRIEAMDYQVGRARNDSLLSIASKKMIPGLMLKLWKLPYMIKMMKLDKNTPESTSEAVRHFDILNRWKTIKNMAKIHEIHLNKPRVEASRLWIESYRKRNREMVKLIVQKMEQKEDKRAVVIVGASHVPYFLFEFNRQYPTARIKFLDNRSLRE